MRLSEYQREKWLHNAGVFLAPLVIIYLVQVQGNLNDGFQWSDFGINQVMLGAMSLYIVNTLLDLLRKVKAS